MEDYIIGNIGEKKNNNNNIRQTRTNTSSWSSLVFAQLQF